MRNLKFTLIILVAMLASAKLSYGQYATSDFVGTWHGYISGSVFQTTNQAITLIIEPDGFYTENTGNFMPTIYPNTQESEYDLATNRYHFWYLQTVYVGMYTYQHHFYEVVYFQSDTLEMHYNFWDDSEPNPQVGTIFLVRENNNPPPPVPSNLIGSLMDDYINLNWTEPSNSGNGGLNLTGYNVYSKFENETSFQLLTFVDSTSFSDYNLTNQGIYSYYVKAVYDTDESEASNIVNIEFVLAGIGSIDLTSTNIYPNPASDIINVESVAKVDKIIIRDLTGKLVINVINPDFNESINVSELSKGIYLIEAVSGFNSEVQKLIIK